MGKHTVDLKLRTYMETTVTYISLNFRIAVQEKVLKVMGFPLSFERKCLKQKYSYLGRRCVTEEQCQELQVIHPLGAGYANLQDDGNRSWPFNGTCVGQCPPGYEKVNNGTITIGCQPCQGRCSHECYGGLVSSIAEAQNLRGCTTITKSLEISISGSGNHIVRELEENLAAIEEIMGYLKVSRSFPLTSLNFLKNLRKIHGTSLEDNRYSLLVLENQNLQELWNWTSRQHDLKILNGYFKFHYNPKLCLSEIEELQVKSGAPNYTNFDVARESNGDKVACKVVPLSANATVKSSTSVLIEWETHLAPSSVLGYMVYYIEAPEQNVTEHDGLDACGNYGWRVIDVPYDTYAPHTGNLVQFLPHLEPFTQYAFYVQTYTKTNTGGQSKIKYFRTLPDRPSVPKDIHAFSNSSSTICLRWQHPEHPNGILTHYLVAGVWQRDDQAYLQQRNYCEYPLDHVSDPEIHIVSSSTLSSQTCCEKSESEPLVLIEDEDEYKMFCGPGATKKHKLFDNSGEEIDPCKNYFYSFIHTGIPELKDEEEDFTNHNRFPVLPSSATTPQSALATLNQTIINSEGLYEKFWKKIDANKTEILITQLHHFAEYTINVFACRATHPTELQIYRSERTDYSNCSPAGLITLRTKYLPMADKINSELLAAEVSNGTFRTVKLTWKEPKSPNGMIVSYRVEHQRTDSGTLNPIVKCLSREEYLRNGGGYILNHLPPGNYSFRVRATSLAGEGPFTKKFHFPVEELPVDSSTGSLVGVLVGGVLVLIGFTVLATLWWKKRAKERSLMIIASVNPDYMSAGEAIYVEDDWEVARDRLKLLRELGQGSFGMVYEGILKPGDISCAVKMINDNASVREKMEFLNEASMMKSFAGAHHVVKLLGVVSRGQPALVIMELMARGDLKTYLRASREPPPPPPDTPLMLLMAAQIADGMAYLEAHKFVHRDLAARNCMVAEDLTIKIGDFGMTRDIYETDYYRNGSKGLLPVRWMSPESLADGVFTSQSDVWSFGVVLWEMTTLAEQPYQGFANEQVLQFVLGGGYLERPPNCPDVIHKLMAACWRKRPSQRPRFLQIVGDIEAGNHLTHKFQQVSFYHSKEGQEMKANMAQQDLDMSCEADIDEMFLSSPPVSFYQLIEDGCAHQARTGASSAKTAHTTNSDNSYVLPGNLRDQSSHDSSNPLVNMKHSSSVPNRRDISDDSYVLPGSLIGPSGRYAPGHVPETERLLSETSSEFEPQHRRHSNADTVSSQTGSPSIRMPSQLPTEDGYVPAENVYVPPESSSPTTSSKRDSGSGRKVSFVESDSCFVPVENVLPRDTHDTSRKCDPRLPISADRSQSYVPTGNVSVDSGARSKSPVASSSTARRLSESSSFQDNFIPGEIGGDIVSQKIPRQVSSSVLEDSSGYVPAENLQQRISLKGDSDSRHRPPNGMVNGYISIPQDQDESEYVPPFK
ncbi:hypothetical protein ANN_22193 [Periplaneta americana]|uniref:Tyrosine-protein kinase receptor n=1 Tax=Periplaneta americana TaxID=6978 RepID=A0ABQ8S7G9_PERAM|nr:hypothetical protein ANN_22193 [Periplaneta americana]